MAIGFVKTLAAILIRADRAGLVTFDAMEQAGRFEDALSDGDQCATFARPSVERGIKMLKEFAEAS